MEKAYLQPVIRNIFGEIPGNSVVPKISNRYFPGGTFTPKVSEFKTETADEKESFESVTPETKLKIAHNSDKGESEEHYEEETNDYTKKHRTGETGNVKKIVTGEETPYQSEKTIVVNKEYIKQPTLTAKEPTEKEKGIKKTSSQKVQKEAPENKESEVHVISSGLLPDSSSSLQKTIPRDISSTHLLDNSSISNNSPQSDNTFTAHSENNISTHKILNVQISETTITKNKSSLTEKELDTDRPDKQTPTIIREKQKNTSGSIDLIHPKRDKLHFELPPKPQTKLVIGKLTVEVLQQPKEKIPSILPQERIIVHSAPKESNRSQGSDLKIKYGLGQL